MKQVLIAIDQLANTLLGGFADETLSARLWRTQHPAYKWVDRLFFWEPGHCYASYQSELLRSQLPKGYRT